MTIERGADIVLGQKLEAGKGFDVRKSFAGRMSQVRQSNADMELRLSYTIISLVLSKTVIETD